MIGCGFWCYLFKRWILFWVHFSVHLPNTHSLFSLTIIPRESFEEAALPLHVALKISGRNTCQGSSTGHWPAHCWLHVLCRPSQGQHDPILRFFFRPPFILDSPFLWYGCWDDTTQRGESTQPRRSQIRKWGLALSLNLNQTLLKQKSTGTLQLHELSISPSLTPCLLSLSYLSWVF